MDVRHPKIDMVQCIKEYFIYNYVSLIVMVEIISRLLGLNTRNNFYLMRHDDDKENVYIVPNNLNILESLSDCPYCKFVGDWIDDDMDEWEDVYVSTVSEIYAKGLEMFSSCEEIEI